MDISIISNTCIGADIFKSLKMIYNNPFIGYLFQIDTDFIKLCCNFSHYIQQKPVVNLIPSNNSIFAQQNKGPHIRHNVVKIPYPIIYLDDIEIHAIHETNTEETLNKFNRRMLRLHELMKNPKHKIFYCLSFSEFINDHNNHTELIDKFLSGQDNNNIKLFVGPTQLHNPKYNGYIIEPLLDNEALIRTESHIYRFNNQIHFKNIFLAAIQKHL